MQVGQSLITRLQFNRVISFILVDSTFPSLFVGTKKFTGALLLLLTIGTHDARAASSNPTWFTKEKLLMRKEMGSHLIETYFPGVTPNSFLKFLPSFKSSMLCKFKHATVLPKLPLRHIFSRFGQLAYCLEHISALPKVLDSRCVFYRLPVSFVCPLNSVLLPGVKLG